jgi:hypothetical protein
MKIAVVHYHLDPGGVTRVIETACLAMLQAGHQPIILHGGNHTPANLPTLHIPELAYGRETQNPTHIIAAATQALGSPPDLWHIHNHSLGKNRTVSTLVRSLVESNTPLLLHLHDLAEDGRPQNAPNLHPTSSLYPFNPRTHYAFLNPRDLSIFLNAGLPTQNAHLLPNPITLPLDPTPPPTSSPPLIFYPVRGIRRKNLGEILLLATIAPHGTRFAISKAPLDPAALLIHQSWENLAQSSQLPVLFNVSDRIPPTPTAPCDFQSWANHSTHWITTSIAEGFGMAYLESASHHRPIIGRNLPHITNSLPPSIQNHLYDRLLIPADWINPQTLLDHLESSIRQTRRAWNLPPSPSSAREILSSLHHQNHLDFANLPESLQQSIILKILRENLTQHLKIQHQNQLHPASTWLAAQLEKSHPSTSLTDLSPWSPASWLHRLQPILNHLTSAPVAPPSHLDPSAILQAHLSPARFHFLQSPA